VGGHKIEQPIGDNEVPIISDIRAIDRKIGGL
jgi:hypothetical protein